MGAPHQLFLIFAFSWDLKGAHNDGQQSIARGDRAGFMGSLLSAQFFPCRILSGSSAGRRRKLEAGGGTLLDRRPGLAVVSPTASSDPFGPAGH